MKRVDNNFENKKYLKAKKRVEDIKGFYKHLTVYVLINFFFIGRRIYKDIDRGDGVLEAFTNLNNYNFFFWWGIGLIIHSFAVFGTPYLFSKDWEERKIKELMNKK